MKVPRGLLAFQVAANLRKICFKDLRQKGSHLIMRRGGKEAKPVVIPLHESLSIGIIKELIHRLEEYGYKRSEAISFLKKGKPQKLECPIESHYLEESNQS